MTTGINTLNINETNLLQMERKRGDSLETVILTTNEREIVHDLSTAHTHADAISWKSELIPDNGEKVIQSNVQEQPGKVACIIVD